MKHFFQKNKKLLSMIVTFAMIISLGSGAGAPARVRAEETEEATITITSQPKNITVMAGDISESLTVAATTTATGGALTFQWYNCEDAAGNNAAEEEGATEATFDIPTGLEAGEYYYYCEVGAEDVDAVQSDVAKVTVENAVAVVEEGETATLTYEIVGGTGPEETSELAAGEKVALSTSSFTPDENREFYGWIVFDKNEVPIQMGYSDVNLTVEAGKSYTATAYYGYRITLNNDLPEDTTIMYGSMLVGNPNMVVVPEFTENLLEGNALMIKNDSMTSAPTLTLQNATAEYDEENSSAGTYKYLIKDIKGPVTLTVVDNEPTAPITITTQPVNVTAKKGEKATFTVEAEAADGITLKYQWQVDCGEGFRKADGSGTDSATYTTYSLDGPENGYKYRCVITDANDSSVSVTSEEVTLAVITLPKPTKIEGVSITKTDDGYKVTGLADAGEGYRWGYNAYKFDGDNLDEFIAYKLNEHLNYGPWEDEIANSLNEPYVITTYTNPNVGVPESLDNYDYIEILKLNENSLICGVAVLALPKTASEPIVTPSPSEHDDHAGWSVLTKPESFNNSSAMSIDRAGKYYLNADLTKVNITINADVTICLNGHTIYGDPSYTTGTLRIAEGCSVTICDCQKAGCIKSTQRSSSSGAIYNLGKVSLFDVTLDASESTTYGIYCNNYERSGDVESYRETDVFIKNSTIKGYYGAVRVNSVSGPGNFVAENCTFTSGYARFSYMIMTSNLSLTNCTLLSPTAAVSSEGASIVLSNCEIECNYTDQSSVNGLIYVSGREADVKIEDCKITNESAAVPINLRNYMGSVELAGKIEILVNGGSAPINVFYYVSDPDRAELIADDLDEDQAPIQITGSGTPTEDTPVLVFKVEAGKDYANKFAWAGAVPEGMYGALKTEGTGLYAIATDEPPVEEPAGPTPKEYNVSDIKVGDILYKGDTILGGDISNAYVWFCRYEYEQGVSVLDEYVIKNELGDDVADEVWSKGWEVFDVVAEDEEGRYSILLRAEDENGIYTKLVAPEVSVEKNTEGAYELSIQEESGYTYYYRYMPLGEDRGDGNPLTYEDALEMAEWTLAEEFKKTKSLYNEKDNAPYGEVYEEAVNFGETGGIIMVLKYLDTEDRWVEAGMNVFVAGEASEGGESGFVSSFDVQFDWTKVPQLEVGMNRSTVPPFNSAPATVNGTGLGRDFFYGWAIKVNESFKFTQEEAAELGISSSDAASYNSMIDDYINMYDSWAMLDLPLRYGYTVNEDDIYAVFVSVYTENGYTFGENSNKYTGTINSNVEVGTCIPNDEQAVVFFVLGTVEDIEQEKENAGGSTPTPGTPTPKEYNVSDIKVGDILYKGDTIHGGDISNAYVWFCRYEYEQGVSVLDEYVIKNELGDDVADGVWAKGWEVFDVVAEDEEGRYSILLRAEDEKGIYTKLVAPEVSVEKNTEGVYELSIQEESGYTYYYRYMPLGEDRGDGNPLTYEDALEMAEWTLAEEFTKTKSLYNEKDNAPYGDVYEETVTFGENGGIIMVLKYLDTEGRWIEAGMNVLVVGDTSGNTPEPEVHEHLWSEEWNNNKNYHWHECEGTVGTCDITADADKNGYGRHVYSNSSDRSCNTCGYKRTISGGGSYTPPYVPATTPAPTPVPTVEPTVAPTAAPTQAPAAGVVKLPTMEETIVDKTGKEVTSLVQDAGTTNKLEIAGVTDRPGAVVTYTSTNTNAVEVDAAGNVTMKNPGMSEITVTVGEGENAKQETIVVVVEEPPMYENEEEEAIRNVRLGTSWEDIPLVRYQEAGQTIDINFWGVKTWMKDKYECVWETSDSSVAVTDESGKVTALKPGVVTMSLGLKNKETGKMLNVKSIEVVIPDANSEKITLGTSKNNTFDKLVMKKNERVDINFFGIKNWKKDDYEYRWTSTEPSTVWVDEVGKVTPVKAGSAIITLILVDKKTGIPKYVIPTTVTVE